MKKYNIQQLRDAWGAGAAMSNDRHSSLVKKCFLTFDDDGCFKYQGMIVSCEGNGDFLIQYFEWFCGLPLTLDVVNISDMKSWVFFNNTEDLRMYVQSNQNLNHIKGGLVDA